MFIGCGDLKIETENHDFVTQLAKIEITIFVLKSHCYHLFL